MCVCVCVCVRERERVVWYEGTEERRIMEFECWEEEIRESIGKKMGTFGRLKKERIRGYKRGMGNGQ